jgi:hypothetical protein
MDFISGDNFFFQREDILSRHAIPLKAPIELRKSSVIQWAPPDHDFEVKSTATKELNINHFSDVVVAGTSKVL